MAVSFTELENSLRTKLEIAATLIAFALGVFAFYSWLEAHDDRLRLAATLDAQGKLLDQARQQSASLDAGEKQRDAALQTQLEAMRSAVAKNQTPQQIAQWLPKQLPLPAPVTISIPNSAASATAASGKGSVKNSVAPSSSSAPPAVATIPQQDLVPIRNAVESCEECSKKLAVAQQDAAAKDQQLKLAGEQLSAAENERDAAITAAKGGGFWIRLRRNAKWFALGAGAAVSALCASGHCK